MWDSKQTCEWIAGVRTAHPDVFKTVFSKTVEPKQAGEGPAPRWAGMAHDLNAMALAADAVVVAEAEKWDGKAQRFTGWRVTALDRSSGQELWGVPLPSEPLIGGLCVNRQGQVLVTMTDGSLACVGKPLQPAPTMPQE